MLAKFCSASLIVLLTACASAPPARVSYELGTASTGGVFSPYGAAFAKVVADNSHVDIKPLITKGSNENIDLMAAGTTALGLVNLGPALDAVSGNGPWNGKPVTNLRAIAPMYESPYHFIALRSSGITSVAQLAGKRIGVGPKGVPAESFLVGLLAEIGIHATLVNGDPVGRGKDLVTKDIDAIWIGASLPVVELKAIADRYDATIFGLTAQEVTAFRKRFPYAVPYTIDAQTYRGQTSPVLTVAIWNFVVGRADLPDAEVKAIALAAMKNTKAMATLYGPASSTRADNASGNVVMPFHPGAAAALRELGIAVP